MTRLRGKRSNGGLQLLLLLVIGATIGTLLEYFGFINLIPTFGQRRFSLQSSQDLSQPVATHVIQKSDKAGQQDA
jgi:hypothetical protein